MPGSSELSESIVCPGSVGGNVPESSVCPGSLASEKLSEAAEVISKQPLAVTLRYLQTATEIAGEKNSTLVFPLPMDLLSSLMPKRDSESS